ncbi:MAG: metal ABC transporter permease [Aquifex sp.]|nr:MAG: metal ABC transporter permease [Aquifex sp.]
MELLSYDFIQRGLLAGILIAVSTALIGVFLILRRFAFLGAGLSHAAFGSIAISFLINADIYFTTVIFTVLIANLIEFLTQTRKVPGDTAIAVIFSSGMALAVIILGIAKGFGENLFSYLFGNILMVSKEELVYSFFVFLLTMSFLLVFYKKLLITTFSEEIARVKGVNISFINYAFVSLTAVVIVASIKAVGVILASSLVVIPAMTGILLANSFLMSLVYSCLISVLSVVSGIFVSFKYDLPPSGTIVGISILAFILSFVLRKLPLK